MAIRRARPVAAAPLHPVVFRWDLDKTYLKSEFESLRDMVRIPFEKPEDKKAVPGVVPLIRSLRSVAATAGREVRVYFISASPPQIAKAIKDKLALDGVEHDGIIFKNQLQHIVRGKFRNLREQVGFKLTELLKTRPALPPLSGEVLFGDDWESDPIIYSLYADVLAGRVAAADLNPILDTIGVDPDLTTEARELAAGLEHVDAVERIYINLERRTPPTSFRLFGARLVPTFNYFQTAVCLFQDAYLDLPAVALVATHLVETAGYTPMRLANSLADVVRRAHLRETSASMVREHLLEHRLLPQDRATAPRQRMWNRLLTWLQRTPPPQPTEQPSIDYHALVAEWRQAR